MPGTSKPSTLASLISSALPSSAPPLRIHHIWHTPSKSDALYSPPKGTHPDPTTLSSHFLAVSLPSPAVIVYGIEVLVYSTSTRTTLFVSKADSTGFLAQPSSSTTKPTASVLRTITSTFLSYLADKSSRRSPHKTTHVSLFARAQDQYLFPSSVKNSGKHVLSDRQLIRWWARCLNPLLQDTARQGYLLVPGLDKYECRPLFPPGASGWVHGHPYGDDKPVRECIPHFPDDPKSRFMMEMEVDNGVGWRGVVTMDSFWELMSFRQECSLGKSVGFVSVVIPPVSQSVNSSQASVEGSQSTVDGGGTSSSSQKTTAAASQAEKEVKRKMERMSTYTGASLLKNPERLKRFPRGRLIRSKSEAARRQDPGKALPKKEYDRMLEGLLNSDFGGRKFAQDSSKKWIDMAGGEDVIGTKQVDEPAAAAAAAAASAVNVLTVVRKRPSSENLPVNMLPTRKKSKTSLADGADAPKVLAESTPVVNTLSSGLVRKKPKPEDEKPSTAPVSAGSVGVLPSTLVRKKPKPETSENSSSAPVEEKVSEPGVNVLSASLIRKKPKVPVE